MKKSRMIAIFASMGILCSMVSLPAQAVTYLTQSDFISEEYYTLFDDQGLFQSVAGTTKEGADRLYLLYRSNGTLSDTDDCILVNKIEFNRLYLQVNDIAAYQKIYQKYAEKLSYDCYAEYESNSVTNPDDYFVDMYDERDDAGNLTVDITKIEDKYSTVRRMCLELSNSGVLVKAFYCPYYMYGNELTWYHGLGVENLSSENAEALYELVESYDAEISVKSAGTDAFAIGTISELDTAVAIKSAIEQQFPDAEFSVGYEMLDGSESYYQEKDLHLETTSASLGDIDGDGNVSVEDAVSVLSYYARQAAGLENVKILQESDQSSDEETAYLSADVNGDGEVTVEDAVEILTYYAKQSAGLDAAW
jgi:hypothetical protein